MIDIQGVGGVPESRPQRNTSATSRSSTEAPASDGQQQDGVIISNAAQAAARISQLVGAGSTQTDVRADRVEAARQRIESGDYQQRDIVATVAERIAKYL